MSSEIKDSSLYSLNGSFTDHSEEINQTSSYSAPNKYKNISSVSRFDYSQIGHLFKAWADVSMINYFSPRAFSVTQSGSAYKRRSVVTFPIMDKSMDIYKDILMREDEKDFLLEEFPKNVSILLNEDNKWGCFYVFPEYFDDIYSPVVRIRELEDVPEIVGGVLTRDMVAGCLSYLRRTPILGDFVYIKLDLSSKGLVNIDVLKYYKYLVYLDLTTNRLTDLSILSELLYLQFLFVSFNNLAKILDYNPVQWFLTEVNYSYNSVKKINDLSAFWSITILDLSHNNIKCITGLETLRYLRRLDLSFNHIQCIENLNHLRLLWLDLSYNNISSYELTDNTGLWTLLHLKYLNLNENNLTSLKVLSGCNRLRELHLRNNNFTVLLELAVYMKQIRTLVVLDLRANPVCNIPGYKEVIMNILPLLLSLDSEELEPVGQRVLKMDMYPDVTVHATRRLLRLLYIQQLSRAVVSPFVPPGDTTEVPIVVIVGHEGVGKGTMARRLAKEYSSKIELARQHTTAVHNFTNHFIEVTYLKFNEMLLAGDFLTYSEEEGESYGLSREEACIKTGKVKIVTMDLVGALMLKLRGYRPYLILATMNNKIEVARRQAIRRSFRITQFYHKQRVSSLEPSFIDHATLQVFLSERFIIAGILHEIIMSLPEEKEKSEFILEPECSIMMNSENRKEELTDSTHYALLNSSNLSLTAPTKTHQRSGLEESLCSLFKELPVEEYSGILVNGVNQHRGSQAISQKISPIRPSQDISQTKNYDASKIIIYGSNKGPSVSEHSKSMKSVSFNEITNDNITEGLIIEPQAPEIMAEYDENCMRSISAKAPWPSPGRHYKPTTRSSVDDSQLWLAILTEARQNQASELGERSYSGALHREAHKHHTSMMNQLQQTKEDDSIEALEAMQVLATSYLRENYDNVHRKNPGLFWDTLTMDDPDAAFKKMRAIIQEIVKRQEMLGPMFDIDFLNMTDYPGFEEKLNMIRHEIAPEQLFY